MRSISMLVLLFAQIAAAQNLYEQTSGIFDLSKTNYKDPLLISTSNEVSSKLKLAQTIQKHNTINVDLVALCTNDLIGSGAEPIFFLNHDEYDLAGSAVGIVERNKLLPKKELIKQGDVIIGLPSSGMHAHGYSLVHKIIEDNRFDINAPPPFATHHHTFESALLEPTIGYANCVLPLCKNNVVKAIAHITKGGLLESISRIIPNRLSAKLDMKLWYIPPIFRWFKHIAHITDQEMLSTFNCGIGMVLITDKKNSTPIIENLASQGMNAQVIGTIENCYEENKVSISGTIPTHAMKVLVVGSSGREHAIAWKIAQSPYVGLVLVAPGNGGTSKEKKVRNIPINPQHSNALITYAKQQDIDLIIVGTKEPLIDGFADECAKKGLRCLGPSKAAALIAESTPFSKEFMMRHHIPTYKPSHDLDSDEISFMVITDGKNIVPLATCQTHKNRDSGERNSIGSYSPAPLLTPQLHDQIMKTIIEPTVHGMNAEGIAFVGFLHTDLMIKDGKPYVIEYHCHLGDPETEAVMMRLKSDFFVMCNAAIDRRLHTLSIEWDERSALGIVVTNGGYTTNHKRGELIVGIAETDSMNEKIFHASTVYDNGKLITNGERILCATALGESLLQARNSAYNLIKNVYWPDAHYRTDIGYKSLSR